jgi:hypothetical protein
VLRRVGLLLFVVTSLLLIPDWSVAYRDVGTDPDDRAVVGYDPDIRQTTRRVKSSEGGRVLIVRVWTYEDLGVFWRMEVFLDSRGGGAFDYRMLLANGDLGGAGCQIDRRGGGRDQIDGRFRQVGNLAECRVRARLVNPNKRIRWRIRSGSGYNEPESETEVAPDRGWYG